MVEDFHKGTSRYTGKKALKKHLAAGVITEDDKVLIDEYVSERQATKHIGDHRYNKIIFNLIGWRKFILKPYRDASIADIYTGITELKAGNSARGKPFKQNTIHDRIRILKPFLFWLVESGYNDLPEKKIRNIQAPAVDYNTKSPDDIITRDEIKALVNACLNSRDRALIAVHYETAARPNETARLKWRDIKFDEHGAEVRIIDQKMSHAGYTYRYSYLTWAMHYLAEWKKDFHPGKPDPDSLVFATFQGTPLDYIQFRRIIERAKTRAGIEKRITPHLFRSSRITHMLAEGINETIVKKIAWDNVSTSMIRTYTKLHEKDVRNEILDKAGIVQKSEITPPIKPRPCVRCGLKNSPTSEFCGRCGEPLTEEARKIQEGKTVEMMSELEQHPSFDDLKRTYDEMQAMTRKFEELQEKIQQMEKAL